MLLRVTDEKKRMDYSQKENEAIQFTFDLNNDKAEEVTKEMVGFCKILFVFGELCFVIILVEEKTAL